MNDKITPSDLTSMTQLNDKLIAETNPEKIREIADIFNMNQAKKEILRLEKYSDLIDAVTAQMQERIKKKPDEFSNKDLIDYLNAASSNIEKAKKSFNVVENAPSIQINQLNIQNEANPISKESREKVASAVEAILKKLNTPETISEEIIVEEEKLLKEEED